MAYNGNLPADDGYLSEFPAQQRENQRALKEDKIKKKKYAVAFVLIEK